MNFSEDKLLKVAEVANRLNCCPKTVYKLIDTGALGHYRCPAIRISEKQLAAYLEHAKKDGGQPALERNRLPRPTHLRHITLR